MFGWVPVALLLFARLPARRAAAAAVVAATLFLPMAAYPIRGLPDYTKTSATSLVVLLAIAIFDWRGLFALRPRWVDVPILLFCLSPFFSALSGGLGLHEGLSVVFDQAVVWGIPFAVGALYFGTLSGLRDLASAVAAGGLVYVPLCWIEVVAGPRLHLWLYGYAQGAIDPTAMRFGGWRPMVFLNNGIMAALWMTVAALVALWLWRAGVLRRITGIPAGWFVAVLFLTALWMKSLNAWLLMVLGLVVLFAAARWRTAAPMVLVLILIPVYVAFSASGLWSPARVLASAPAFVKSDRGHSLEFRLLNDAIISGNARERLPFGWGRTSRAFYDGQHRASPDRDLAIIDSLWVGTFAMFGAVGLAALLALLLLPMAVFLRRFPASRWMDAAVAPAAVLAVALLLFSVDDLANGYVNPVYLLAAGGLSRCLPEKQKPE